MTDKQPKPYINCPEPLLETAVEAIEQDYVDSITYVGKAHVATFSKVTMDLLYLYRIAGEEYIAALNMDERYMFFCWVLMSEGRM